MRGWGGDREDPGRALAIDVERGDHTYAIGLEGVLDLSTSDTFKAAIDDALGSDAARITVDLDRVDFIDSTGLAAVLGATRRVDGRGRLRMTRGTGEVAQLFRLTALDLVLPFE